MITTRLYSVSTHGGCTLAFESLELDQRGSGRKHFRLINPSTETDARIPTRQGWLLLTRRWCPLVLAESRSRREGTPLDNHKLLVRIVTALHLLDPSEWPSDLWDAGRDAFGTAAGPIVSILGSVGYRTSSCSRCTLPFFSVAC